MSHRVTRQARSRIRSRIAVVVAGVALLSWGGPGANAFWAAVSTGGSAAAAADTVASGATPSTSVSAGNVTLAWAASTTVAGRPVTGYTVARYSSASGGQKFSAGGTCAAPPIAGLGCVDQGVPTGTWYYTVTPMLGQWSGSESVRSAVATVAAVDTTPPAAPTVTAPAYVNSGNVAAVQVSGTTESGASVALSVTDGVPAHTVPATATADSSGVWNATVSLTGLNAGTLTYSAVATDTAGNHGTAQGTATSFKDVTAPTVSNVMLADGGVNGSSIGVLDPKDKVTVTFSEPMDPSTICSKWAAGADWTVNGNGQVTVNVSSTNILSVTVTSGGCPTSRIGTVALAGAYHGSGTLSYGGNGQNASSLSWNSSAKTLTITLGTRATGTVNGTAQSAAAPSYSPSDGIKDSAGNSLATATFTSTGTSRF
jgi:hypothetical protein